MTYMMNNVSNAVQNAHPINTLIRNRSRSWHAGDESSVSRYKRRHIMALLCKPTACLKYRLDHGLSKPCVLERENFSA